MESRLEMEIIDYRDELKELRRAHKKAKEKWLADRIKAVFLVGTGRTVGDVADDGRKNRPQPFSNVGIRWC